MQSAQGQRRWGGRGGARHRKRRHAHHTARAGAGRPQGQRREGQYENRVPYREPRETLREVAGAADQDELVLQDLWSPEAVPRFAKGPKGYRRSDERMREDICDELMGMQDIDSSDVEVNVTGGAVSLTGTVPDRSMKYRIEQVADRCTGVVDITNLIKVRGSSRS
jgi:osmotically-inducible protein OsmY